MISAMEVITLGNIKGGVSKSTVTRELGHRLAENHRVLLVDLDPKPTLTRSHKVENNPPYLFWEALSGGKALEPSLSQIHPKLYIATTDRSLNSFESELRTKGKTGATILAKALRQLSDKFDYVLIDPEGKAGLLITNALIASTALIIPVKPTSDDLGDLPDFLELITDIQKLREKPLTKIAKLPTQVVKTSAVHSEAIEALGGLKYKMLPSIGHTTQASAARFMQVLLGAMFKNNPRVEEYNQLAKDVKLWLKKN